MKNVSDAFLTEEDWQQATKRFEAGAKALFCELVAPEPVLAEAAAIRSSQLAATVDAQDLTPEVKMLIKTQGTRMLLESLALIQQRYERVLAGLMPAGPNDTPPSEQST